MTNTEQTMTVTSSDQVGDRLLVGRFQGAYCHHVQIVAKISPRKAVVKPVFAYSIENNDGTFSTVWRDIPVQARAQQIFDSLDTYGKWCVYTGGTAFTTYEDEGQAVCVELKKLVSDFAAAHG